MSEGRTKPWVTYALIAANVAMFAVELANGASVTSPSPQQIFALGGNFAPSTLGGQWWRLGSSMFLHFGALHIGLNMLCLYQARVVELLYGRLSFAVIYLLAGLGGGIAHLLVGTPNAVAAGASGAVFGVYGGFGAFLALRRSQIEADAWGKTARSIGQFLVLNLAIGFTIESISVSSHVGGLIVGFAAGAALLAGPTADAQRTVRALGIAVLGLGLTAVAVMTIKVRGDMAPVFAKFNAVENASVSRFNEAAGRAQKGELSDAEFAKLVQHDVIEPYKQMRRDVLATPDIPKRLLRLFGLLDQYTAARLASWEAANALLHEPDAERRQPLLDAMGRHDTEVVKVSAAYAAELDRLKE